MKIVPPARKRVTSDAETGDVFQSKYIHIAIVLNQKVKIVIFVLTSNTIFLFLGDGCVILKMIVVTIQMKRRISAMAVIGSVLNQNSVVETINAYQTVGDVIMMTIAETEQMNKVAKIINVKLENSNVILDTASRRN